MPFRDEDDAYEYFRQRALDDMNDFPADDVLIARGKYSTLGSEKRIHMKRIRENSESIMNACGRIMRSLPEDTESAIAQFQMIAERCAEGLSRATAIQALEPRLAELKPLAWGKEQPDG